MSREEPLTLEPTFVGFVQGTTQRVRARTKQMESCGVRSATGSIVHTRLKLDLKEQEGPTHSINKQDTVREGTKIKEPIKTKGTKIKDILTRETLR